MQLQACSRGRALYTKVGGTNMRRTHIDQWDCGRTIRGGRIWVSCSSSWALRLSYRITSRILEIQISSLSTCKSRGSGFWHVRAAHSIFVATEGRVMIVVHPPQAQSLQDWQGLFSYAGLTHLQTWMLLFLLLCALCCEWRMRRRRGQHHQESGGLLWGIWCWSITVLS